MAKHRRPRQPLPRPIRLLMVAACGLGVGLAFTVGMFWEEAPSEASRSEGAGASSRSAAGSAPGPGVLSGPAARSKGGLGPALPPPAARRPDLPSAAILRGRQELRPRLHRPGTGLLPLSCLDARRIERDSACTSETLRAQTTLDWRLQERVAAFLRARPAVAAAFVAVDVESGAVRALISHEPGVEGPSTEALRARAPAASIFKLVSATALLEKGIPPWRRVCTHGGARGINREQVVDDPRRDTRCESLLEAFAHSRNAVFAKLAYRELSRRRLRRTAVALGFESQLSFAYGLAPSRAPIPGGRFNRARAAAGFSAVSLNPVHAALLAATVARDGTFPQPWILKDHPPVATPRRVMGRKTARSLRKMMLATVDRGTCRRSLAGARISSGAKSGSLSAYRDGVQRHHTWMVGFAPADNPRIAFAALVVNDPSAVWHIRAGALARYALDVYAESLGR